MSTIDLDKLSRQERLKQIIKDVKDGKTFSAFDLAVRYDVSLNVIYRDISALREGGYIPSDWKFDKRLPLAVEDLVEDVQESDPQ